jgi:hypothetical protein
MHERTTQRFRERRLILHVMVSRQEHNLSTWIALLNVKQGEHDAVSRATILRLHDQV